MKKALIAIIGLLVFLPMTANAAKSFKIDCGTASMTAGTTNTCKIYADFTGTSSINSDISFKITPKGTKTHIVSVTGIGTFTASGPVSDVYTFTTSTPQTGRFDIFEVVYTIDASYIAGEDCGIQILQTENIKVCDPKVECCEGDEYPDNPLCPPPAKPICKVENGKYYGKDGTEVTYEVYKEQCDKVENPDTGSFIPYIIIGIAGIGTAGLYIYSKNKTKFHKI